MNNQLGNLIAVFYITVFVLVIFVTIAHFTGFIVIN